MTLLTLHWYGGVGQTTIGAYGKKEMQNNKTNPTTTLNDYLCLARLAFYTIYVLKASHTPSIMVL